MAIFTAIATFVGTAIAGAIGLAGATILGVSAASLIGGVVVTGGLIAASYFLSPTAKKAAPFSSPAPQYQAVINQASGPRRRGYGRVKAGGTRAFWDSRDGLLYQIVMMHSGTVDGFEKYYLGDQEVTLAGDGNVEQAPKTGYAYIYPFLGGTSQVALAGLVSTFPGIWTEQHQLKGIAYLGAVFKSPPAETYMEVFPEGHNTPVRAVVRLSRVFDPRSSTTAWSDNPALCIRDFLVHPDGYRLTASDIDTASFNAMADLCDEAVALAAGGSEVRYRLWGMYDLNADPKETLSRMLATCDGELFENAAGKIEIRGGKWDEPTVTIEDKDVLSFTLEQGNDAFAAFNQLRILYTSPNHDYQSTEAQEWDDLTDQATRGVISQDFPVDMVPSPSQARRLAKIYRAKQNPRWRGTVSTNLVGLNARGERTLRLVLPELQINDTFLIISHAIRADMTGCEIGIVSLGEETYEWTTAEEGASPPAPQVTTPSTALPTPSMTIDVQSRQVTAASVAAVVVASVTPPARTDIRLESQIRLDSSSIWEGMSTATGEFESVSGVVVDDETYKVRSRFRTAGAVGPWTTEQTIVITANPTAPAAPSSFSAIESSGNSVLNWVNPSAEFFRTRVFRSASAIFGGASEIAIVYGSPGQPSAHTDPAPASGTWYYWVVALNESNIASTPAGPQSVTIP